MEKKSTSKFKMPCPYPDTSIFRNYRRQTFRVTKRYANNDPTLNNGKPIIRQRNAFDYEDALKIAKNL
jgi:hypothetical protein